MNIFDYVNAPEMAAFITKQTSNAIPYLGKTLFPNKRQLGTDISWLKGADGLPVAIAPSNYDAKATLREREGFSKVSTEMAFFREGTRIGEKDRQEINKLLNHPNSDVVLPILRNIFDDVKRLVEGVETQAEYMRMKLLQGGSFEVKNLAQNCIYKYDYNMSADNKVTVTNDWNSYTDSDPVADLKALADKIEDITGVRPTRAIMNRKTFNDMVQSQSIKKNLIIGVSNASVSELGVYFVSDDEAKSYVEKKTGIRIAIYNKKYTTLGNNLIPQTSTVANTFIEDDKVVLLPSTTVGSTWKGTTPEESDLLTGGSDAQVEIVDGGTAITTFKEKHPVNVVTIVSAVMIPSFEGIDTVGVLTTVSA